MASPERKIAYRQGFRSSKPVTNALNLFLTTPRRSFLLFSTAEFVHTPLEALGYDDQDNKSVATRRREINDKVGRLDSYSKNMAARTIHLSLPASGVEDSRGIMLRFSPLMQEATTYWKMIKGLHDDEDTVRSPAEIMQLTQQSIYVGLKARELRTKTSLRLARQGLAYVLRDPDQRYDFSVENIPGLIRSEVDVSKPEKTSAEATHPDVIDENVV